MSDDQGPWWLPAEAGQVARDAACDVGGSTYDLCKGANVPDHGSVAATDGAHMTVRADGYHADRT